MSASERLNPEKPELSLRETKKRAARESLSWAALHLATERGLDNVRVEDIAAMAGVSARTFNNYFSSKEEAICSFNLGRQEQLGKALLARPAEEPLWDAIIQSIIEENSLDGQPTKEYIQRIRLLVLHPSLQGEFLKSHAQAESILADAIAKRVGISKEDPGDAADYLQARLMAGAIGVASRIAMHHWLSNDEQEDFLPIATQLLRELAEGMPTLKRRPEQFVS